MARKKSLKAKDQRVKAVGTAQDDMNREDRIMNSIVNVSVILMSTMMGAFTKVLTTATSSMASGMAEALGGKEAGNKVEQEMDQNMPEIDEKIKAMVSDMRRDICAQMKKKKAKMEPFLSDPAFEGGPKIIENYDFKLPKLNQELDDNALASYVQLLVSDDVRFVKMFKELTEWLNSLPKPPGEVEK